MVVMVGVATLMRRGWRAAALHTLPLAAILGVWWLATQDWDRNRSAEPLQIGAFMSFVATGIGATFSALGQVPGIAWVLGVVVALGLAVLWIGTPPRERRRQFAIPAAMLVAMMVLLVINAVGRSHFGAEYSRNGRYLHLQAALVLPSLALAADALLRRWRILVPISLAAVVVGIPGNIAAGNDYVERIVHANGHPDRAPNADAATTPTRHPAQFVHAGGNDRVVARRSARRAAFPQPPTLLRRYPQTSTRTLRVSWPVRRDPRPPCRILTRPIIVHLDKHQSFGTLGGAIRVTYLTPATGRPEPATYTGDHVLAAGTRPLKLRVETTTPASPARLCGLP